ncbi:serine hydrolase domain-containing protein [Gemmatimonadota bacterium]
MIKVSCSGRLHWVAALAIALVGWSGGAVPLPAQDLPRARPGQVGLDPDRLQRLPEALRAYVDEGRLPGGVILVTRRGGVALQEAFGYRDREARDPMEPDDLFRIASQTKALVSTAAMILVEEGRLLLSDPVGRHLPEFLETTVAVAGEAGVYDVVKADRAVTIRDLLTHTSGVGYGGGVAADRWEAAGITGWYFAHQDEPVGATVARMADLPFESQPGERWVYGYSTDILGAVVEVVSGLTLDAFLQARLLEPLGMKDTHFYVPREDRDRLVAVYSLDDSGLARAPDPGGMVGQGAYVDGPRTSFSGGAGLLSTAEDYARFLQMILNGGELDGVRILSPKTVELMTADHVGHLLDDQPGWDGLGFGLGFSIVKDLGSQGAYGSVGEYGWGGAYHSVYWVDPAEELVVVYLTQVIPADGLDDHNRVRSLVYQAIVDGGRR